MHKNVFVAVAALCLTAPCLVQAADQVQLTTLETTGPAAPSVNTSDGTLEGGSELLEMRGHYRLGSRSSGGFGHRSAAHAMLHRQRFNSMVGASRNHFHAASTNHSGQLDKALKDAEQADRISRRSQTDADMLRARGASPSVIKPFQQRADAARKAADARFRAIAEAEAKSQPGKRFVPPGIFKPNPQPQPNPSPRPSGPGFPGSGASGGRFSAGGSGAPGARYPAAPANPNPGDAAPRYAAQPAQVTDKPVCLSGTWATQNQQQQYVCLSWFYQGRIYTPDQLEQVLAQRQ
jgi:hypothetical protein